MTQDAYWDELGIAWTAMDPNRLAPHLQARLRRQARLSTLAQFAGLVLALAGLALGTWTIWRGISLQAWFFVTRGIAITTIALLAGFAAGSFKGAVTGDAASLAVMVEQALLRAQRWQGAIRLGFAGLGIAAVFGTIGYQIRIQLGKPSAMSPIEALIVLALLAMVLFLLHRRAASDVAKYRYLLLLLREES